VALYLHFFQRKGVFIPLMGSRLIKFYNNHFMLSDKDCCLYRFCHITLWTICTARIRFVKRMGLTWQRLPCWHMNLRYFVSSTSLLFITVTFSLSSAEFHWDYQTQGMFKISNYYDFLLTIHMCFALLRMESGTTLGKGTMYHKRRLSKSKGETLIRASGVLSW